MDCAKKNEKYIFKKNDEKKIKNRGRQIEIGVPPHVKCVDRSRVRFFLLSIIHLYAHVIATSLVPTMSPLTIP